MADPAKAIEAIREARPPATDRFTYLTIVEANLSPEVLPTLNEVLQDASLTQEIGWDLVFNLVNLPGSEACLETIARLGNPREVILKVLETLELLEEQEGYDADVEDEADNKATQTVSADKKFIALMGMLAILHKRIKTKYPSRFLAQSLQTVYGAYVPNEERTAAVINLVYSLSKQKRPPLPSRKSSVNVANPDLEGDASKNAPDPEADAAEKVDEKEEQLQQRLLLSFATCVLEGYANGNDMAWAARLVEFLNPYKIVTGRKTLMAKFREDKGLAARDDIVGKLVALIEDLGLESCTKGFVNHLTEGPLHSEPLTGAEDLSSPNEIALSTGGCVCLLAYWVFSLTVFDARHPQPNLHIFPEHYAMLDKLLQDDAHTQIQKSTGTVEALVAIGLWLHSNNLISSEKATPISKPVTSVDDPTSDYMRYIHLVTLIALFHPQIHVRNAASTLAGVVLHSDPSDEDRLRVLYDLLENCTFASLKARAVAWLREEIIARSKEETQSAFNTPQALETVQYVVFPNLDFLEETSSTVEVAEYLAGNAAFHMQAVNFGLFLWGEKESKETEANKGWAHVLPDNMEATVRGRWFDPLLAAVDRVLKREGEEKEEIELGPVEGAELRLLRLRMEDLDGAGGFTVKK
ncbi:YAP1-binding protein 2 [Podospora australis]|uniref:YAP1-binding protein 2 n=1 Tax=Podospora australis TaxID=1536484 RepID=A0AAN7AKH6_9PEZI|nr:YAP1-binding protein 2 [Podospora australis]